MSTTQKLSLSYVKSTMDALILKNGKTSTLEVKLEMRSLGTWCTQTEVHTFVEEVYELNSNDYKRELINNHYYEYAAVVPTVTGTLGTVLAPAGQSKASSTTQSGFVASEMPKSSYMYNELVVLKHYPHQNDWVVFSTDAKTKYSVFDAGRTRDQVRSKFASLNKVKIQEVRAQRVSNLDIF